AASGTETVQARNNGDGDMDTIPKQHQSYVARQPTSNCLPLCLPRKIGTLAATSPSLASPRSIHGTSG
ncbi:hypothetical protein CH063_08877, partial [Colletotrichum higginsianum]